MPKKAFKVEAPPVLFYSIDSDGGTDMYTEKELVQAFGNENSNDLPLFFTYKLVGPAELRVAIVHEGEK